MGSVFLLTLRQSSGRLRLLIMAALAALPVLIAFAAVADARAMSVEEFETFALGGMLAGSIMPLVVLAIATVAFGNEVEDRTLANLTLAPIPRWRIAVPKLLATASVSGVFIAASAFATSYIAFNHDLVATFAVTLSAIVGVLLYASVFVWLGLVTTQAIGFGLAYIVLWEGFFAGFVSGVRYLSISRYATALMHGLDARRFATTDHVSLTVAILTSLIMFGGFIFLTVRRLRRMDVP